MAFWGCSVKPGKEAPFVPSGEGDEKLHLSQVCMAPGASKNARATLMLRVGESDEPLAVAALREGATESVPLDLILDHYTEFSVQGNATLHLTGYFVPEYGIDGHDHDDEDEEGMEDGLLGFDEFGQPVYAGEYDSEEDSDYETEEEDGLDENDFGSDDDDEEESESEEEEEGLGRRTSSVTIEDITEEEAAATANGKKKALALPAPEQKKKNKKAEEFEDDDVEGSDEESDEEEPPKKQQQQQKKKEEPKKAAANDKKRKAEESAAKAPAQKSAKKDDKIAADQVPSASNRVRRFANGFEIEDVKLGPANGKMAKPGKKVFVKYVGKLKNGKVFDSTKSKPFNFRLGVGEVIKGWDRGIEGMRVGDKRRLVIPPVMGYGTARTGPIPPNSELHFDVELVDVK